MATLNLDEVQDVPGARDLESALDELGNVERFLDGVDEDTDTGDLNSHMLTLRDISHRLASLADDMYRVVYNAERRAETEEEQEEDPYENACPQCGPLIYCNCP